MNNKQIDIIKKTMECMNETDNYNRNIQETTNLLNDIFHLYGIDDEISKDDIEFGINVLWDKPYYFWDRENQTTIIRRKRKLSEIIFNHYYPIPTNTTFYHFTTFDNFKSIIDKKELWLFNLIKRFSEEEFRPFYYDHGIEGYENSIDDNGYSLSKKIMEQTFYMSFSRSASISNEEQEDLWYNFGDSGLGVRIQFDIQPKTPDFRNVFYKKNDLPREELLLSKISNCIQKKYHRNFVIAGLSKIGAFYLHSHLGAEHESRFVVKEKTEQYAFNFEKYSYKDHIKFIKLPFVSEFGIFKIISIQPGFKNSKQKVEQLINKYNISSNIRILDKANF